MIAILSPAIRHILLDIEGTTSSIQFVTDVMFPFARKHVLPYLRANWSSPELVRALNLLAVDLGRLDLNSWLCNPTTPPEAQKLVSEAVYGLMDGDSKATGLKELQGLIWKSGFESGELVAHVYPDVLPAIRRWVESGRHVWIYSSGSIAAQKLFFGHTTEGNLLPLFAGHFDTTNGPKKEYSSYETIVSKIGCQSSEVLFCSDVMAELLAARQAGLSVALSLRPNNPPQATDATIPVVRSFAQIELS